VRRFEGERLHPTVDSDDVRWFDEKEVTALAAHIANKSGSKGMRNAKAASTGSEQRTPGEIAALVFERFEQRQSLAEIVVGLRVEPEAVAQLYEQYCRGLTERQLKKREPGVQLIEDLPQVKRSELERRLAALPADHTTRISISRWRGSFPAGEDQLDYAWLIELGGFYVAGASTASEIVRRFGPGSYRVTAVGFSPDKIRWEVLVEGLTDGG
jgi:hypothetical protein